MNKVSLIITVLNESKTINNLLNSIAKQTLLPNEVIIIDGGSIDETIKQINIFQHNNIKLNIKSEIKIGNRSVGRNYAISIAKHELIAITDAGCELSVNWLKELINVYQSEESPVISGYYSSKSTTDFQRAVTPYVLVMPDKVDENNFLPATRSMMIEKNLFVKLGGFNEQLSDNEDFAFAQNIKNNNIKISFAKKAIVYWIPRNNLKSFYNMIFRFARGDAYAKIFRPKVLLIFLRYIIFILLILYYMKLFLVIMCFYFIWSIQKNKKYVGGGWKYLPVLQLSSDLAVIHGTIIGIANQLYY